MAIIATCLCGAQFKVPDDTAGEQMTCPMCATMVLVPSLDIAQIEDAEKKAKPPTRLEKLRAAHTEQQKAAQSAGTESAEAESKSTGEEGS